MYETKIGEVGHKKTFDFRFNEGNGFVPKLLHFSAAVGPFKIEVKDPDNNTVLVGFTSKDNVNFDFNFDGFSQKVDYLIVQVTNMFGLCGAVYCTLFFESSE